MLFNSNYVELDQYEQFMLERPEWVPISDVAELSFEFESAFGRLQHDFAFRAALPLEQKTLKGDMAGLSERINHLQSTVNRIGIIAITMIEDGQVDAWLSGIVSG